MKAALGKDVPEQFAGDWQGEIAWYKQGSKLPQKFKMQLKVQPADTAGQYTWQIIYGAKGEDNRPYILKGVDTAKGHWMIDEKNTILLDQYWIGHKFYSVFSVAPVMIVNSYWREGEKLMVEFVSFPLKPARVSGSGTEDAPTVESFDVRSYQKGILYRAKTPQKLPLRKLKN